jgi:hypothetical protein
MWYQVLNQKSLSKGAVTNPGCVHTGSSSDGGEAAQSPSPVASMMPAEDETWEMIRQRRRAFLDEHILLLRGKRCPVGFALCWKSVAEILSCSLKYLYGEWGVAP